MRVLQGLFTLLIATTLCGHALAQDTGSCVRPGEGSLVSPPPDLYSRNGELDIALNYFTDLDSANGTLFCFVTTDGKEAPTLHVYPGDHIRISLADRVPNTPGGPAELMFGSTTDGC